MTYRITIDTTKGERSQEFQTKAAARRYVVAAIEAAIFQAATIHGPEGTTQLDDPADAAEWLRTMLTQRGPQELA